MVWDCVCRVSVCGEKPRAMSGGTSESVEHQACICISPSHRRAARIFLHISMLLRPSCIVLQLQLYEYNRTPTTPLFLLTERDSHMPTDGGVLGYWESHICSPGPPPGRDLPLDPESKIARMQGGLDLVGPAEM